MSVTVTEIDAAARSLANLDGVDWPEVDVWGGSWEEFRDGYYAKARRALEAARAASEVEPPKFKPQQADRGAE